MIDGVFLGSEAVAAGLITWGRLRGRTYRRIFPDVYAPADLRDGLRLRSLAAYLFARDRGGVLGGFSAALLLGADCAPPRASAEVLVERYVRPRPGLLVRYGTPSGPDVTTEAGCTVTSARRTAWDLCRRLPPAEAVVALDALARVGRFRPDELLHRRVAEPGARGCRSLDAVVALADPRAESPPETRLRLQLGAAGLAPEVQYRIRDEYGFVVARVDLAYPEARLAVEYDGADHFTRNRRERDAQRDTTLAAMGWVTLRFGHDQIGAAQTVDLVHRTLLERTTAARRAG